MVKQAMAKTAKMAKTNVELDKGGDMFAQCESVCVCVCVSARVRLLSASVSVCVWVTAIIIKT